MDRPDEDPALPPPPGAKPGDTWNLDPAVPANAGSSQEAPQPRPRARRRAIVAVVVAIGLVAGAGVAAGFFAMRGSDEELLGKIPDDADVVAVAYLDPSVGQKVNLFRMAEKFPDLGNQAALQRRLGSTLDEGLQSIGLTHEDLGWVGIEIAIFVDLREGEDPAIGVLVDSDDDAAARAALDRIEDRESSQGVTWRTADHDGVTVTVPTGQGTDAPAFASFDGTVVLGSTEDVVDRVIATAHGSHPAIQEAKPFTDTVAQLPTGRLALVYANVQAILQVAQGSLGAGAPPGAPDPFAIGDVEAIRTSAMTISAEPDGLAMESVTLYDESKLAPASRQARSAPDHENPLLRMVPGNAVAVFAGEHLDGSLQAIVQQMDSADPALAKVVEQSGVSGPDGVLAHLTGDVAVEASPDGKSSSPESAVLIGTDDPSIARTALDTLIRSIPLGDTYDLTQQGEVREHHHDVTWKTESYHGTDITYAVSGAQVPIAYGVVGDVGVIATSKRHLERLVDVAGGDAPALIDGAGYRSAIEGMPTSDAVVYVDVEGILSAVRAPLDPVSRSQFDQEVGSKLDPVHSIVLGAEGDAASQRTRVLVRIP